MIRTLLRYFLFTSLFMLMSCEDDDKPLPSYRQDLAELRTDIDGRALSLYFDDGRVLALSNPLSGLTVDSIYRIQALYVEEGDYAKLYSANNILSSFPVPIEDLKREVVEDPIELISVWISPRYFNFLVGLKTGGQKQMLGFLTDGIEIMPGGVKKLKLQFYHDQMQDPQFYTQELYMSCPIYEYEQDLERGRDSVEMIVNTYHGKQSKTFLFN